MKYYKFELNMIWANIICILLFVIGIIFAHNIYGDLMFNNLDFIFLELLIYLIMHELIHGITFSLFCKNKSNVKYGAMLEKGVLYAMCQERISKKGAYISLLAPTITLTIIAFIIGYIFRVDDLIMLSVFNLSGAAGDLLMTAFLIRLPKNIQYIDYDNVIGFYLLSKDDLSKYKSVFVKYKESGIDSDDLINHNIKQITITKASWIIIVVLISIIVLSHLI